MRYRETPWDGTGEDINQSNFENRPQKVILTNMSPGA